MRNEMRVISKKAGYTVAIFLTCILIAGLVVTFTVDRTVGILIVTACPASLLVIKRVFQVSD